MRPDSKKKKCQWGWRNDGSVYEGAFHASKRISVQIPSIHIKTKIRHEHTQLLAPEL